MITTLLLVLLLPLTLCDSSCSPVSACDSCQIEPTDILFDKAYEYSNPDEFQDMKAQLEQVMETSLNNFKNEIKKYITDELALHNAALKAYVSNGNFATLDGVLNQIQTNGLTIGNRLFEQQGTNLQIKDLINPSKRYIFTREVKKDIF